MGHSYAPRICHQTLTQPSHAMSKNAVCPTKLTSCGEGNMTRERSAWWEHLTKGRIQCEQVHKMGQFCAPHPCLISSRNR